MTGKGCTKCHEHLNHSFEALPSILSPDNRFPWDEYIKKTDAYASASKLAVIR